MRIWIMVVAVFAGLLAPLPAPAVADEPPVVEEEQTAFEAARSLDKPVEIASRRTPTQQVYAQPDGTQRLIVAARPVRVARGGTWVDVDPALAGRADGRVAPAAVNTDVSFSGGGAGPLVQLTGGGVSVSYTWPAALPAPALSGATATYAEVLPGVDLKLTADAEGFSQVLVVKSAPPEGALAEVRIGISVTGGTLRADTSGNLTVYAGGGDGHVVFHGTAPKIWDSSGPADEPGDRLAGPRTGDVLGAVAMSLQGDPASTGGGTLVLTPDQEFLRTPGLTYPLYLDPPMHGAGRLAFAYVSKHFGTTKYYGTSDVAKVGYYNDPNTPAGPTKDTYRSFFRMNTAPVNGKHIISATLRTYETHAWSCSARPVELWLTGAIGTGTTWNNQPGWIRRIQSFNVAKGYNSSCNDGGVDFNATSAVVEAAGKKWSNLHLGLRAANEGDTFGWKKFRNNPVLEITYNTTPNVPDQRSAEVGASAGVPCATGAAAPYITSLTPTLRARVSDADGGRGQTVRGYFEWHVTGGAKIGERITAYVGSGTPVTAPIPAGAFADGRRYSWRVMAQDGVATSGSSAWSPWCEVIVDRTRPSSAPAVASADYPETPVGGDPVPGGGVGRMGVFTFRPGPGDTDIGGYLYALNDDTPGAATAVTAAADGSVTVRATPSRSLLNTLYVWSRDRAGNIGPFKRYEFSVRPATGPVAHWTLDETGGTAALDASGNGNHATLTGGATRTAGRAQGAVALSGGAEITPAKTTALIRTDRNFTVATWARLDQKGAYRTLMSQDGTSHSGFYLQFTDYDKWPMVMTSADGGTVTFYGAESDAPPQLGVWTHLAATFDTATGRITLYVDGRPQKSTATNPAPWHASGRFAVGRAVNGGNQWAGAADDLRVYDRVLYPGEIAALANRPVLLEGHWRMDETSGTCSPTPRARAGTPPPRV